MREVHNNLYESASVRVESASVRVAVRRRGFTILEVALAMFMGTIFALLFFTNLVGYRNRSDFEATEKKIAAVLREAQSRASARSSSTTWGVRFENSTNTTPFYALFHGTYGTSTRVGYYSLPASVAYVTSSLNAGSSTEVTFSQITGAASASTTIVIQMRSGGATSTIRVSTSGAVSY
jgi:type II secretory pathway pseudopilin PulG